MGRALHGKDTPETRAWVAHQLERLAQAAATALATEWAALPLRGEVATRRDTHVTYFTNQASRMDYDRYRADGWDTGSGMIESGCRSVIGQQRKGAGKRWSDAGTRTVANVRLLLFNHEWDDYWAVA